MGKQSKRKNKRRGGGGGGGGSGGDSGRHHNPTGLANDPLLDVDRPDAPTHVAASTSRVSAVVARVRHVDPRVRHAALVALSRTLYDASSLELGGGGVESDGRRRRKGGGTTTATTDDAASDPNLLRALSERVLDVDVPCATIAVGCLSNYVNFRHQHRRGLDDDEGGGGGEDVTSTVLVPILMKRVRLTSATVRSMMTTRTNASTSGGRGDKDEDKHRLRLTEQWTIQSLSLSTLAGLIENRPRSILPHGGGGGCGEYDANASLTMEMLTALDLTRDAIVDVDANYVKITLTDDDPIAESASNASRALHSLFDDNPSLVESLLVAAVTPGGGTIATASASATTSSPPSLDVVVSRLAEVAIDERMPNSARLHACGSLLAIRRIVVLGRLSMRLEEEDDVVEGEDGRDRRRLPPLASRLQAITNDVVIPRISSSLCFDNAVIGNDGGKSTIQGLLTRMISLSNRLSSMKDDEAMEMRVVSQVNARGESARSIARRQQEMKRENTTMMTTEKGETCGKSNVEGENDKDATGEEDPAMVVELDGDDEEGMDDDRKSERAEDELREELDAVVSAWRNIAGTQKLALELVANLCSGGNDDDDDVVDGLNDDDEGMIADDDDEHMWDSDDEARLLSASSADANHHSRSNSNNNDSAIAQFERETYESMADLPLTLLRFFRHWVEFPSAFAAASRAIVLAPPDVDNDGSIVEDVDASNSSKANILPALVSRDIDEILSTCVLCLGNVVSCNLLAVGSCGADEERSDISDLFWRDLVSMLKADDHDHHQHVTSLMLSLLLHNQPQSQVTLVDMATLDRLISLLLAQHRITAADDTAVENEDGEIDDDDAILQMQRNVISILGKLCTGTHPETMDTKVCRALLSRLTLAGVGNGKEQERERQHQQQREMIIISHEILNVLMDVYGNDDCHEQVFVKECVLDHFRRCLPWFKRTIKRVAANRSSRFKGDPMEEEGFVWNETALNATRFIKYKQNQ